MSLLIRSILLYLFYYVYIIKYIFYRKSSFHARILLLMLYVPLARDISFVQETTLKTFY